MNHQNVLIYVLLAFLIVVLGTTWGLSFSVPPDVSNPAEWIRDNKLGVFILYIIALVGVLTMFLTIALSQPSVISLEQALMFSGLFFISITILLLSNFFIVRTASMAGKRFIDTHPLIFYTCLILLILGILASIVSHMKLNYALAYLLKDFYEV
jgi:hypothetical protein